MNSLKSRFLKSALLNRKKRYSSINMHQKSLNLQFKNQGKLDESDHKFHKSMIENQQNCERDKAQDEKEE